MTVAKKGAVLVNVLFFSDRFEADSNERQQVASLHGRCEFSIRKKTKNVNIITVRRRSARTGLTSPVDVGKTQNRFCQRQRASFLEKQNNRIEDFDVNRGINYAYGFAATSLEGVQTRVNTVIRKNRRLSTSLCRPLAAMQIRRFSSATKRTRFTRTRLFDRTLIRTGIVFFF